MHLVPKHVKKTFQNNLIQKFIYIAKNKKCQHGHVAHKYKSIYVPFENGGVVMKSKICINQFDVKLSMSNYTTLINATHWYMPNY
jgi:hypothetical protein